MALQDDLRARRDVDVPLPPTPSGANAPKRRRRWDLVLAWAVILAPALALASFLLVRQRVGDLEARLVRETNELFTRTHARPVHVSAASPGTIGEAIARHLPPVEAAAKALREDDAVVERVRDTVSGAAPIATLPPSFAETLDRLEPDLNALLAASRTERADFPQTRDLLSPLDDGGWLGWQLAGTAAGVRMRTALAADAPGDAIAVGLDALALGRDAAIAGGLVGRMVCAAMVSRLSPPVGAALDALPDARARREALRGLRTIRDAIPRFSRTLADEITYTQLYAGDVLSSPVRAALDARARSVGMQEGFHDTPWWKRLAIRDGWRDLRAAQDALVAAADLPDAERAAAFAAVQAGLMRSLNPFAAIALPSYERYARRADATIRRLDALVLAAAARALRDERGRWPASVQELAAAGGVDASEAARLADATLELRDDGRALRIRVPLPHVDEKDASELTLLLVHARTRVRG